MSVESPVTAPGLLRVTPDKAARRRAVRLRHAIRVEIAVRRAAAHRR